MTKRDADSAAKPAALVITPESPYPVAGGGALRCAPLLEYLARRYTLDVVAFRERGAEDPAAKIPPQLARQVHVLTLPYHSRSKLARVARNASRFLRGAPPLVDRYAGLARQLSATLGHRRYALAMIEHFWCAPYIDVACGLSDSVVLDLHNVESVLQQRSAIMEPWPAAIAFRRFAGAYREMERRLLPRFDRVLVTSEEDARHVREIAPGAHLAIYPNTLAAVDLAPRHEDECVVFSGNLEYHANLVAVRYFHAEIWPILRQRWPSLEWRLVGKNPHSVAPFVSGDPSIRLVGPVENAVEELAKAKVAVVPLLAGSGTRFKILEAWAAGRAVVSTSVGAEGLGAGHGEHLLIADAPQSFADAVSSLLEDQGQRQRLGKAGRELYLEKFTWEAGWKILEQAGI